jgi:alpha-tubulin suppressor-like RCC1 family protein
MDDEPATFATRPAVVAGLNAIKLSMNYQNVCVVTPTFTVKCWGDNTYGQTGQPIATALVSTPTVVNGLSNVADVSVGRYHACALLKSGAVRCWGQNTFGQLGGGGTRSGPALITPRTIANVTSIAAGAATTCASISTGRVWCWGWGNGGELGIGKRISSLVPLRLPSLLNISKVASFQSTTCAIDATSQAWCWGGGWFGQLGNGSSGTYVTSPVDLSDLSNVSTISIGQASGCATSSDGSLYCWGSNSQGLIGDGSNQDSASPVQILPNVRAYVVSVGEAHACVALAASIRCWGNNTYGQLGNGTTTRKDQPEVVTP